MMKILNRIKGINGSTVLVLIAMVPLISCEDIEPIVEYDEETVEMEALADADFDEIDDLVSVSVTAAELSSKPGARIAEDIDDDRFTCAEVTFDRQNKTIIINFGDGCEGARGRIRSGIIRITYSGFWLRPGSVITITLENFAIDGRQIEGTRTITNITESQFAAPTYRVTLSGGRITFLDGTMATREVDRIRRWVRADNPLNDEYHILTNSTASGTNRSGKNYEVTIVESLIYKRKCRNDLVFLPVSGIKEIVRGDNLIVIDFGDGTCDNIITVSYNGVIDIIEISPRPNPNS